MDTLSGRIRAIEMGGRNLPSKMGTPDFGYGPTDPDGDAWMPGPSYGAALFGERPEVVGASDAADRVRQLVGWPPRHMGGGKDIFGRRKAGGCAGLWQAVVEETIGRIWRQEVVQDGRMRQRAVEEAEKSMSLRSWWRSCGFGGAPAAETPTCCTMGTIRTWLFVGSCGAPKELRLTLRRQLGCVSMGIAP